MANCTVFGLVVESITTRQFISGARGAQACSSLSPRMHSSARGSTRCRERGDKSVPISRLLSFMSSEHRDFLSEARLEVLSTPQRGSAAPTPTSEDSGPSDRKKRDRPTRGEKNRAQEARIEALEDNNKQKWSRQSPQTPPALRDSKNSTSSKAPLALRDKRNSTARPRRVPDAEWKAMSNLGPTGRKCKF